MTDEELAEWADEAPMETVKIGKKFVKIRAITDPSQMADIISEAKARAAIAFDVGGGNKVKPKAGEAAYYVWLAAGSVEPKLTYLDILKISRKTGFDCVTAGERVARLSGAMDDAVDEAKNASGEEATEAPSGLLISELSTGSVVSSLPA